MQFGINKCVSLVVRWEVSRFLNNNDTTICFLIKSYLKTNCSKCTVNDFRIETDQTENE